MKGGTLFSGIGAPECAMPEIDWRWCAEIDPFAAAVHKARFPGVRNLGDVTKVDPDAIEPVDLVVFGSPCQSFSVAGKRLGLDDPRGNLALVALALIGRLRPRWMVFENVPGLLSSDEGRDFGAFLGLLGQCGYGFAYRILDAQYFGVPQRRRRVFVVGHLGDWRPPAAVLFEPESLRGDPPPRREAGERVAASLSVGSGGSCGHQYRQKGNEDALIPDVAWALQERDNKGPDSDTKEGHLIPVLADPITSSFAKHGGMAAGNDSLPHNLVAFQSSQSGVRVGDRHATLDGNNGSRRHHGALIGMSVRRLTPVECERLQGLPDNWTAISYRGKPAADGPRYRALGNSMAVPVLRWILDRLLRADEIRTECSEAA